ncbi:hypothetical protein C8Q80DRAFT_1196436 [Daedaleopsis nitida]|nr:hypothetical protein C8Q80DRAFT_1196436 [Daedaleopsis nitida]
MLPAGSCAVRPDPSCVRGAMCPVWLRRGPSGALVRLPFSIYRPTKVPDDGVGNSVRTPFTVRMPSTFRRAVGRSPPPEGRVVACDGVSCQHHQQTCCHGVVCDDPDGPDVTGVGACPLYSWQIQQDGLMPGRVWPPDFPSRASVGRSNLLRLGQPGHRTTHVVQGSGQVQSRLRMVTIQAGGDRRGAATTALDEHEYGTTNDGQWDNGS